MTEEEFQKLANKIKARTVSEKEIDTFCEEIKSSLNAVHTLVTDFAHVKS